MRTSAAAWRRQIASVSSLEALSETISSKSSSVWARMDAIARSTVAAPLNTGSPTDTRGDLTITLDRARPQPAHQPSADSRGGGDGGGARRERGHREPRDAPRAIERAGHQGAAGEGDRGDRQRRYRQRAVPLAQLTPEHTRVHAPHGEEHRAEVEADPHHRRSRAAVAQREEDGGGCHHEEG